MLAVLNSLNAHNFLIFQPILMILVSKFMVHKAFSDKAYLSLGLLSPLIHTHYYNSNLIWHTVSHRVDEVIPSDHPRR